MGGSNIASIAHALIDAGWTPLTDVMMAYNVSMPDMKVFYSTLNELRFSVVKYPTPLIIIVGKTVSLNKRDAEAQKVLVTGTTAAGYSGNGKVVHTPLIKIEPSSEWHYTSHDIIIFTSRYGVSYFFKLDFDIRQLSGVQIFSVGKTTTAELRKHHLIPDFESPTQSAEGIINYFKSNNIVGKKILLPRSDKGLKTLSDALAEMGNNVTDVAVYTNTFNDEAEKVNIDDFQKIVFSSPSGVEAFKRKYGKLPEGIPLLAKGKTTMEKL
jgi:uroporphyrinogen III methyltransferase/synthase